MWYSNAANRSRFKLLNANMIKFIEQYLTNRRIRKFLIATTMKLSTDYGESPEYTEGQVKAAFSMLGYDNDLENLVVAIFCNEKIAKELGIKDALIQEYKGYPRTHSIGSGYGNVDGSGGFGGGDSGGGGN